MLESEYLVILIGHSNGNTGGHAGPAGPVGPVGPPSSWSTWTNIGYPYNPFDVRPGDHHLGTIYTRCYNIQSKYPIIFLHLSKSLI